MQKKIKYTLGNRKGRGFETLSTCLDHKQKSQGGPEEIRPT